MTSQDRNAKPRHEVPISDVMESMRSMTASKRRHPSYSYEIPEPRSHVQVLAPGRDEVVEPLADVVDLAAFRLRREIAAS